MEEQEYLAPDFDPSTLTVPRLRSILVAHSVNYPSSAKKGQLIDLFNEHVASQARKLRNESMRVKRTSRGIVDVPSQTSSYNDAYDDEEVTVAQSTRSSGGGRRTTRARTEEAQEVLPTPKGVRHSTAPPEGAASVPARRASSKHARTVDTGEEPEPKRPASRGKSRLSAQTPSVVKRAERFDDDDSPFSSDNVFQSGSSPPAQQEDRRRTTMSAAKDVDRRRSQARRKTDEVKPVLKEQRDGVVVPSRKSFEVPAASTALKRRVKEEIQPSEEFTPEEQLEVDLAEQTGELVPTQREKAASGTARLGVSGVLLALLGGIGFLYSQEKFNVGYCGEGHASREIAGVEIPEWADILRPTCEPCPPHAICGPNFATRCEPDFVLTPHPLSVNGILPLPLPPSCEPDSVKAKKVEQVRNRAIEELRKHNAEYECGELSPTESAEVPETELKTRVSRYKKTSMGDREFEELWASAIGEVREAEEVVVSGDGSLRSTSLARLPLACAIRRSLRETLRSYFWQLVTLLFTLTSTFYARHLITSSRATDAKAKRLAALTLDRLSNQAALHAADPQVYGEGYLEVGKLRDDVLRNEWSTWGRKKLWDEVARKVEKNANVRPMVREGRSGDVGRVWEWVGAVGAIEDGYGSGGVGRRKSGRVVSFEGVGEGSEMSEIERWREGGGGYY